MGNLLIKDWRYRIGIEKEVYLKVREYVETLETKQKNVYNEVINWYINRVNLDNIIDKFKKENKINLKLLDKLDDKIIKIPLELVKYYENKINCLTGSEEEKSYLRGFMYSKTDDYYKLDNLEIIEIIYGKEIDEIKEYIEKYDINKVNECLMRYGNREIPYKVSETFRKIKSNKDIIKRFGKCKIKDIQMEIADELGFGEWDICKNKYIVNINENSLYRKEFEYGIYTNVYPGIANKFYGKRKIDFGKVEKIEGWSKYCLWNIDKKEYGKYRKNKDILELEILINNKENTKEKLKRIGNKRYNEEENTRNILIASQYLGHKELSIIGGIMYEKKK